MALADLMKFAKEQAAPSQCKTCRLAKARPDLLAELRQGRAKGVPFSILSSYLRTKGEAISETALADHWKAHEQS